MTRYDYLIRNRFLNENGLNNRYEDVTNTRPVNAFIWSEWDNLFTRGNEYIKLHITLDEWEIN